MWQSVAAIRRACESCFWVWAVLFDLAGFLVTGDLRRLRLTDVYVNVGDALSPRSERFRAAPAVDAFAQGHHHLGACGVAWRDHAGVRSGRCSAQHERAPIRVAAAI